MKAIVDFMKGQFGYHDSRSTAVNRVAPCTQPVRVLAPFGNGLECRKSARNQADAAGVRLSVAFAPRQKLATGGGGTERERHRPPPGKAPRHGDEVGSIVAALPDFVKLTMWELAFYV